MGRSCILIEGNHTRVLLDCGIKMGKTEEYPQIEDSKLRTVDAIVLSHAHLDHCGYLPHVFSTGWSGYVYTTKPTADIVNLLLSDYQRVSKPKNATKEGFAKVKKRCRLVEYGKEFRIKGLRFRFYGAGHILGSSLVEVTDGRKRVIYTGDMSMRKSRMIDPAHTENLSADTLIIETTNGEEHEEMLKCQKPLEALPASIRETINRGGKVIIPALAVGRSQEVLFMLDELMRTHAIPQVPVYIDGMIGKIMQVHRNNARSCRKEMRQRLSNKNGPFTSPNFVNVKDKRMRLDAIKSQESCIIVTTSGMLNGGPVLDYLKRLAHDERNKLIFVSYQVEGTQGRKVVDGEREMEIDGKKYKLNMQIELYRMSGHADRPQLLNFIAKVKGLRNVFLIHGEEGKEQDMQSLLKGRYHVEVPVLKQEFAI